MENDDAPPPPPPANNQHIKLPSFWPNNIISCFAMAEGQFVLRGINDELICYYNVLTALPEAEPTGSRRHRQRRPRGRGSRCLRGTRKRWTTAACATSTSRTPTRRRSAGSPARGRETSCPALYQCRHAWIAVPHRGSAHTSAFPLRPRGVLLHTSPLVFSGGQWTLSTWPRRQAHQVLG
jgi:hypothetical protein